MMNTVSPTVFWYQRGRVVPRRHVTASLYLSLSKNPSFMTSVLCQYQRSLDLASVK